MTAAIISPALNLNQKQRCVIIIDDSLEDRAEIRRLILQGSEHRYVFIETKNGESGVAAVLKNDEVQTCVVLDYNLPDLDAPQVLAALTGKDGLPICPVVVLTGGIGTEYARLVLRAGAQDYISKDGLTPSGLTRVMENAIERLKMARELLASNTELQKSQRDLQSVANNTPDVITRFDSNFRFVFVNTAAQKASGHAPSDFVGKTSKEMGFPDKLCDLWENGLRHVFTKGKKKITGIRL